MRSCLRTLAVFAFWVAAGPAFAQDPAKVRLRYARGAGAEGCPDESALRDSVRARLGYDPFAESASKTVRAAVEPGAAGERVATVQLEAADGRLLGDRRLTSSAGDCRELAAAMELAITIAIDPLVLTRPAPPAASPPPPLVLAEEPPPERVPLIRKVEEAPELPAATVEWAFGLGPIAATGAADIPTGAPTFAVGGNALVELRYQRLSVSVEARADLPTIVQVGRDGAVTTWRAGGGISPCVRWEVLGLCALGMASAQTAEARGLTDPRSSSTPLIEVGARGLADLHATSGFSFRFFLDARVPLTTTTLTVSGTPVWNSPTLSVALGLMAVGHLGR